jgi:hypothetical protein
VLYTGCKFSELCPEFFNYHILRIIDRNLKIEA